MEPKEALSVGYSRSATSYDITVGSVFLRSLWNLLPFVGIAPAPSVLDVGCGTGINLIEVARTLGPCKRLVGVDLAPGMIEAARAKAALLGLEASFVVGDIEKLEIAESSFDLIVCNSVYHWFTDRPRTLKKLGRSLRTGGQIIINGVAEPGFQEWQLLVNDVWHERFGDERPFFPELPLPAELLSNLRAADILIEQLKYQIEPMVVRDVDGFLRMMLAMAPTFFTPPSGSAVDVASAIADAMTSQFPQGFMCTTASIAAVGRKLPPMDRPPASHWI